jgi:hypothetical protein
MLVKNPLFKEKEWWDKWLDRLHPERVVERNRELLENRRISVERWQQEVQRRTTATIPFPRAEPAEPVVQNLRQWIAGGNRILGGADSGLDGSIARSSFLEKIRVYSVRLPLVPKFGGPKSE